MTMAVISLRDLTGPAGPARQRALAQLDGALRDPGAFLLGDVPVPDRLVEDMHAVNTGFFSLPDDVKAAYRFPADPFTGWCGGEYLSEYGSRDHKEMYHIGPRMAPTLIAHGMDGTVPLAGPGVVQRALATCPLWPADPDGFVAVWHDYYRAMQEVAASLGRALAELLGVAPSEWFAAMGDNWADLAANYYPPVASGDRQAYVYNGAHRDLTLLTILHQDDSRVGGLAVETVDGRWLDVEPVPDTYVVNAGELLTFLSGGRWRAAPHQVTVRAAGVGGQPRMSVPFFYRPSDERVLSSWADPAARPIEVGSWVLERKRAIGSDAVDPSSER